MRRYLRALGVACAVAAATSFAAAADDRAERERIVRERAEAKQRYAEREAQCRARFVVSACIDGARRERRDALEQLDAQQRVLDEAERKRRAAERLKRIRARTEAQSARERR